jgi:hypothetical protein
MADSCGLEAMIFVTGRFKVEEGSAGAFVSSSGSGSFGLRAFDDSVAARRESELSTDLVEHFRVLQHGRHLLLELRRVHHARHSIWVGQVAEAHIGERVAAERAREGRSQHQLGGREACRDPPR